MSKKTAAAPLLLGCIADDFTGATDLANNLVRAGMPVIQSIGVPAQALPPDIDAVVIALKSRTIASADAVRQSLAALHWLREAGARQIYFKYCSTFDSTPAGNIGPVTEALMDALGCDFTVATPAFPDNGRAIFKGHLFVGDVLLEASGMRDHPLTPMRDSNLVRVLQQQTQRRVGLVEHRTVARGSSAIRQRFDELRAEGIGIAIVDAVDNDDLLRLASAVGDFALVSAGSGLAIGLPRNFGLEASTHAARLPAPAGRRAVLSGSCSEATNRQVAHFIATGRPSFAIDAGRVALGEDVVAAALEWVAAQGQGEGPVLLYSTAPAGEVQSLQARFGAESAGSAIEQAIARIAVGLVAQGVGQLVVAGGETSGACVQALDITQLRIGAQIDPGVPWCHATAPRGLHVALKSGNFGSDDFFTKAFDALARADSSQEFVQ